MKKNRNKFVLRFFAIVIALAMIIPIIFSAINTL
jgi:hypothetical protein